MPSLRAIRHSAADGYKNRYFQMSSSTGNSNTTIIKDANRNEPVGEWSRVDAFVHFEGGALDGVQRRVMGFSPGDSLTIAAAVAASIATGFTYAMYKTFPIEKWNLAINESLMDMAPDRLIQTFTTFTEWAPVTGASFVMQIPTAAVLDARIVKLDRQDFDGSAYEYREMYEGTDYEFFHQGDALFARLRYTPVDGRIVRVHYEKRLATLTLDTDVTNEPLDQVLYGARMHIAVMEGDKEQQAYWAEKFTHAKTIWPITDDDRTIERPRIIVR